MTSFAVETLRVRTGSAHQALDREFDAVQRLSVLADRPAMLRRYHLFHSGVEGAINPYLTNDLNLEMPTRMRSASIAAALDAAGERLPVSAAVSLTVTSRAAALGALYVIEGSTLGGRIILRTILNRGVNTSALAFLDPYGSRSGTMWRAVLAVLERDLSHDPIALARASDAAAATFDYARKCLCDPEIRGPEQKAA